MVRREAWRALGLGGEALYRLLGYDDARSILDVGSGAGIHAGAMRDAGREVFTISLKEPADHVGDFLDWSALRTFDAIWACHVLEHQPNPGQFLRKCHALLKPGGLFVVSVPPAKHNIVGGHVTLWNAGLLLYNLILAGFDCRDARLGSYGYNISVIVTKSDITLPPLDCDSGDVVRLAEFFPIDVVEGFDGQLPDIGWQE